jgi:hypothetical protein
MTKDLFTDNRGAYAMAGPSHSCDEGLRCTLCETRVMGRDAMRDHLVDVHRVQGEDLGRLLQLTVNRRDQIGLEVDVTRERLRADRNDREAVRMREEAAELRVTIGLLEGERKLLAEEEVASREKAAKEAADLRATVEQLEEVIRWSAVEETERRNNAAKEVATLTTVAR